MQTAFLYPDPDLGLPNANFPLHRRTVTLGRHPNNDISLLLESVSRFHARLEMTETGWTVQDVGSSNGTFVNGQRVETEQPLSERDTITLGRADFTFSYLDPEAWRSTRLGLVDEPHTSSVNIVGEDLSTSTILSTQLSTDSSPMQEKLSPEQSQDIRKLQHMTQRLMTIYKLSDLLRSATTQEEILASVMNLMFDVLPADRGVIMLLEGPDQELEPQIVRFRSGDPNQELNISRTIIQKCLTERVAVLSRDAKIDARFNNSESIMASDIRSAMCVPLASKKNLVGILFLDTKESVRAFTEDDLTFAASLANEVAMTLDNIALANENIKNERLAAVGQTIAGLAHNIKNILQLARGGLELMDTAIKRQAANDVETFWPIVKRGIDRMQELTQEMLDYSRQSAPDLVEADVNVVIRELAETFRADRVEAGAEVSLELADALPMRRIDPDGLNKALMNLLSNAVDAFDGAGGKVIISSLSRGETIWIKVADNGKGIPRDKVTKIFQPFFTTKGSKGTGLGLSMTRKYIEDMAGTISVESTEGGGTVFTISLPPHLDQIRFDMDQSQQHKAATGAIAGP